MKTDKRKKNIAWTKNHRGEDVLELSVHWKDGKRYRRYMPNMTVANKTLARIKAANIDGTWPELRKQLSASQPAPEVESQSKAGDLSIEELTRVYYDEWCLSRHQAPDFDQKQLRTIVRILGERRLQDFKRDDANEYYKQRRGEVSKSSANHGLTVLSGMLRWALEEKQWITQHPMENFKWAKIDRKKRIALEGIEVRRIVAEGMKIDDVAGRCIGIVSETALRIGEALNLKRHFFEVRNRQIVVEPSKDNPDGREVPLSPWAIELADGLPTVIGNEYLFVSLETRRCLHYQKLTRVLEEARLQAGISWAVRPHDLRHFRALTWLENGNDLDKVREWMGHKDLSTTQVYLRYVKHRARAAFDESVGRELEKLAACERESGEKLETK